MCPGPNRVLALALFAWGCSGSLPDVELDVTSSPVGAAVAVAPCNPADALTSCFLMNNTSVLLKGQTSDRAGIYGIPSSVTQFELLVQMQGSDGSRACDALLVHRQRIGQRISIAAGTALTIACEQAGDCDMLGDCPQ